MLKQAKEKITTLLINVANEALFTTPLILEVTEFFIRHNHLCF
jgi:hypothetical protein